MNTGPIIGGTHDGEMHSFNQERCVMPAYHPLDVTPFYTDPRIMPNGVHDTEVLRWVPFYFTIINVQQNAMFGFWVSLTDETRNMHSDAEFRLFILQKLAARYREPLKAHADRAYNDPRGLDAP